MPSIYEQSNSITLFKPVDVSDVNIVTFKAHKSWAIESGSTIRTAISSRYIDERNYLFTSSIDDQFRYYRSVDLLFYKNKNPLQSLGIYNSNTERYLYDSASIFSIEYRKVGEGIKPKSFRIESVTGSYTLDLKSDIYGNIYDSNIPTSSIIPNVQFYEGFNQYFNPDKIEQGSAPWTLDISKETDRFVSGSVTFTPGVLSTTSRPIGYCAEFNGSGSFIIPGQYFPGSYTNTNNYSISFFVSSSKNNVLNNRSIICKNGTKSPFHVAIQPDHRVGFYVHLANNTISNTQNSYIDTNNATSIYVTSTTAVSSSWNHVVCQKSGSYLQIYVNGVLESSNSFPQLSASLNTQTKISNDGDVFIGGWPDKASNNYNFIGKLDEFRVYNKSLNQTEISYLNNLSDSGSMLQTNVVGNIFYKQGIGVISSPNSIYNDILNTPYLLTYKSTITLNELSVLVKIKSADFNLSMNNSMIDDSGKYYNSELIQDENFTPYITTIGLYNSKGELLVIGKLAQPVKKINNVDLNILVKLDLDNNINKG